MTEPETRPNVGSIIYRLDRIEARQREYGMHDPDCPERLRERAQQNTGSFVVPVPCTCWLAVSDG